MYTDDRCPRSCLYLLKVFVSRKITCRNEISDLIYFLVVHFTNFKLVRNDPFIYIDDQYSCLRHRFEGPEFRTEVRND